MKLPFAPSTVAMEVALSVPLVIVATPELLAPTPNRKPPLFKGVVGLSPTTPPLIVSVPVPPEPPLEPPTVRPAIGPKVPLVTLTVPTPVEPTPICHAEPVTKPPATFSVPVPLAPSWKVPFSVPETSGPIRRPLSTLIVMLSGISLVVPDVPMSWSVPEFVLINASVPVPAIVLLIVSELPLVWLNWSSPSIVIRPVPVTVTPSSNRVVLETAIVPTV